MTLPIKSRQGLTRCASCRTHIVAEAIPSLTECPFCGANLHRDRARWMPSGRSALLAASLIGFTASACGGSAAPDDDAHGSDTSGDSVSSDDPDDGTHDHYDPDPADDGAGTAEYGVAPDHYDPDPADDGASTAEYGVAPDHYEEEPADDPQPMARYGIAPSRR